ncbi:MAG: hypothetical protein Kow00121_14170 [Elainellaceae cyanobacterium]
MVSNYSKVVAGTVFTLVGCLGAIQPAFARPLMPADGLLAQVNQPEREAVPNLNTTEIRGRIVGLEGDQVQVRTTDGGVESYTIPEEQQELYEFEVGDDVVLLVREDTVIEINPSITSAEPDATVTTGATGSSVNETTQSGSMSQQETTTQQVETQRSVTTQQTQTAPTTTQQTQTAPTTTEPVRALW